MSCTRLLHAYQRSTVVEFVLGALVGLLCCWSARVHRPNHSIMLQKSQFDVTQSIINQDFIVNHTEKRLISEEMAKRVRVFALILTMPKSKLTKAVHVKATWGKRLNGFMFISSEVDPDLPSIRAVKEESRDVLWEKTRQGIMYAYNNQYNYYDFFMKADDDTYVVVENLRFLLSKYNSSEPFFMGRRFNKFVKQGYFSGGAGYVMSRAALKLIAEGMKENGTRSCQKRGGAEDVNLGECAQDVGVKVIDSLDEHGQEAFHPFDVPYMMDKSAIENTKWIGDYNYFPMKTGFECCSDHSVSFHYVTPLGMYTLDYLIYRLYPYAVTRDVEQYQILLKLQESLK